MKKSIWLFMFVFVVLTLTGCSQIKDSDVPATGDVVVVSNAIVKEFSMDSFTTILSGQYFPQYSLKEITVKKGDTVKIKIKVTSGMHDFNIDEFNVSSETPLNEETLVAFVADKAGSFIYYCSKPGHRANWHRGTLIVTE